MSVSSQEIEVKFTIAIPEIDEAQRLEAERKAREALIMELLRQGNISAGRAAELLGIDRWQLSDLMGLYRISPFAPQTSEELDLIAQGTYISQKLYQDVLTQAQE